TPSRPQGNPPKMRAMTISCATHKAAPERLHSNRWIQLLASTPIGFALSSFPPKRSVFKRHGSELCVLRLLDSELSGWDFGTWAVDTTQTQIAGKKARKLLRAIQPRAGASGTPCQR